MPGWELCWGLGVPGSHPGSAQEWDKTLQKVLFPLVWGALPCLSALPARRRKGSLRNVGVRVHGGTHAPYPATEGCEEQGENLSLAAAGAGEQQLLGPGLLHPLRISPGCECSQARGVRGAGAHPGAAGSAASDSPCPSSSGAVPPPAETRQMSPVRGTEGLRLPRCPAGGRQCSRTPVPALGAHALGQDRPGPP